MDIGINVGLVGSVEVLVLLLLSVSVSSPDDAAAPVPSVSSMTVTSCWKNFGIGRADAGGAELRKAEPA